MNLYIKQKQTWRYSPVAEHLTAGTGPETEGANLWLPKGKGKGREKLGACG